jgi:hypothetical protein
MTLRSYLKIICEILYINPFSSGATTRKMWPFVFCWDIVTVTQLAGFAPSLQARSSRCRPGQRLPMKKLIEKRKEATQLGASSACRDTVDHEFPFNGYNNMLRGFSWCIARDLRPNNFWIALKDS